MPNSYPSTKVALGPTAWTPAPAGRVPATNCPQPASCPACGGLDCLCRPRFFAGQLLTEDDLNRLESYVVNKNKLHNRYLHGWGVVCGLEVVCDPCGAGVVVRSGYALAPCGEDIVVCADQSVDVCALITACQPPGVDPCPPAVALGTSTPTYSSYVGLSLGQPASDPCGDAVDRWVLAICYDEQTSRGVMPLRPTSSSCGCGATSSSTSTGVCGCAGKTKKGGCGSGTKASSNGTSKSCGCAGSGTKTATTARSASTVACEPTLICEGFRFIAYKQAPLEGVRVGPSSSLASLGSATTADAGPLIERVLCCWESLLSRLGRVPTTGDRVMRTQWSTDMRAALLDFVSSYPTYDCGLAAELRAVPTPDPQQDNFDAALLETSVSLATIAAEYLRYCLCQALLPPCPDPVDGDCVPLALIEVRRSDCRIVDICNWGARRIALTFPQLQYWASPLQLGDRLISALERLCCTELTRTRAVKFPEVAAPVAPQIAAGAPPDAPPPVPPPPPPPPAPPVPAPPAPVADGMNVTQTAALLALQSFKNQGRTMDAATVLLDAMGFVDDGGQPLLTPFERASPVSLLLANQLTQPLVSSSVPLSSGDK